MLFCFVVYNWSVDSVISWLSEHVELSQYVNNFRASAVEGRALPRYAVATVLCWQYLLLMFAAFGIFSFIIHADIYGAVVILAETYAVEVYMLYMSVNSA